jgi:predicted regulator of Ras-like GTPase activity (Roadblock/LC7/MglB family)
VPTLRDLVAVLRRREGVEAAVVLGGDGLVIAGDAESSIDAEQLAAHLPGVVTAAEDFGAAAGRGELATALLEYDGGLALVAVLSRDALLVVLLRADADVAPLIFDVRRSRAQLAALV